AFVESRLKEIKDYESYREKLADASAPAAVRGLPDLAKVCAALDGELALPPQYAWQETAAAKLRDKWIADCGAIQAAVKVLVDKYRQFERTGTDHMVARTFDADWLKQLDELTATASVPPFPLNDAIPNSPEINQPRGEAVTFRVPYNFDEVQRARS